MSSIPVRCFTCGKVIGGKWKTYTNLVESGIEIRKIFDILGLRRYCCKRMFLTQPNIEEKILSFEKKSIKNESEE